VKRTYSIIVVCQALAALAAVAALKVIAKEVSVEAFGRYSLYQSVVAAASLLLIGWPNAAVLRFGREEWVRHGRAGTTLAVRLTLFAASISVSIAAAWAADSWLRELLKIDESPFYWIVAGILATSIADLMVYVSQAVDRSEAYGFSPLIARGGFLVGIMLIPVLHRGVTWSYLAASMIAATAAASLVTLLRLPIASWGGFRLTPRDVGAVLKYSWTIPFAAMSVYVVNWVDGWMIREFRGVGQVGVYNWAYQTTAIASLACSPIAAILTPRVIDARIKDDRQRLDRYASAILPVTTIASVAVALGLACVYPVLALVVSPAYAEAYPIILLLMAAFPFQLLGYLVTPIGNAYETLIPRFMFVSAMVALFNTVGDFVLVPRIGVTGAAVSTATAFGLGGLLQAAVVRRCADFGPLWRYTAPAWILVPTVAALLAAGPRAGAALVVTVAAAGALVYGLGQHLRAKFRQSPSTFTELARLPRALTLSDITAPPRP